MSHEEKTNNSIAKIKGSKIAIVAGVVSLAFAGVAISKSVAQSNAFAHAKIFASDSGSWHNAGFGPRHHNRHGGFANLTEEEIEAKATRFMKHVAIEIDATDEQQEKITALIVAMAKDVQPIRKIMRSTRKEVKELLLNDEVDRAALEALRLDRLAEADRLSKSLVNAMADVAEVLTVEQRKTLEKRIEEFRLKRGGKHRG